MSSSAHAYTRYRKLTQAFFTVEDGTKYGVKLAYNTQISFSAPSYAAECLAAQQAGVKALFIGDSVTVVESVAKDCAQQGYFPTMLASDGAVGIQFATTPGSAKLPTTILTRPGCGPRF